jgi:hypothetical protein
MAQLPDWKGPKAAHGPTLGHPSVDDVHEAPPLLVTSVDTRPGKEPGGAEPSFSPFEFAKRATTSWPDVTKPPKLSTVVPGGVGTRSQVAPALIVYSAAT